LNLALKGRGASGSGKGVITISFIRPIADEKTVFVRSYYRHRHGAWETVVSHYRRLPRR